LDVWLTDITLAVNHLSMKKLFALFATILFLHTACYSQSYCVTCGTYTIAAEPDTTRIIDAFLSSGGAFFMPAKYLSSNNSYGRDCGQFILTKAQAYYLLSISAEDDGYDINILTEKLSVPQGSWGNDIVCVVIPATRLKSLGVREPRSTDCGVNSDWRPGGHTLAGCCEAFIPQKFVCKECEVIKVHGE
jgi:hypothetical protein